MKAKLTAARTDGDSRLAPWSKEEGEAFGTRPFAAKHRLPELDLFADAALTELLEKYPRDRLQAFTMGTDPLQWTAWKPVDTAGVSGLQLFAAVQRGRLWLNLLQVHMVDGRYRDVLERLYANLSDQCPGFRPTKKTATLLISSPTAMVYYHTDAEPNLLWHIRGRKRVWIYPAQDRDLISQRLMEDIFAHVVDEEVPYRREFDQKAVMFDLMPGEVLSWPQNAPHRVVNLEGVNVSLSTIHETEESDRRKLVYCANRLFQRTYHIPARSIAETGMASRIKQFWYRVLRRMDLVTAPTRRAYITNLRIDPNAATGISSIASGPVLTEFSQKDFSLKMDASGRPAAVPSDHTLKVGTHVAR